MSKTQRKNSYQKTQPQTPELIKKKQNKKQKEHSFDTFQSFEFHLNSEQPETLNAKRKLQQFSEQIQIDEIIQSKNRFNLSMSVCKDSIKNNQIPQHSGWVQNQDKQVHQKVSPSKTRQFNTDKSHLIKSNMRQTLRFKNSPQINDNLKKYSLDVKNSSTNKVNLSFKTIMPEEINRQIELTKHIVKKNKVYRPYSSANYSTSHKILTFDKSTVIENKHKSIIHSKQIGKDDNSALKNLLNQSKNMFLKTSSIQCYLSKNKINTKKQNKKTQIKQCSENYGYHRRSYSDVKSKVVDQNQNIEFTSFKGNIKHLHKKYKFMNKKSRSSHSLNENSDENLQQQNCQNKNPEQNNLMTKKHQNKNGSLDNIQINQKVFEAPINKKYQHDYCLLQKMLKHESRSILDSQLHSYLTHMKSKYQSNNYYGSAIFNKVKPKKCPKMIVHNDTKNNGELIKKLDQIQSNTSLHYKPLSTSKNKFNSIINKNGKN